MKNHFYALTVNRHGMVVIREIERELWELPGQPFQNAYRHIQAEQPLERAAVSEILDFENDQRRLLH